VADWTTDAVDALEQAVATVRDKTVVPAQNLTGDVWLAYLIVGGIFVIAGAFCWSRRSSRAKDTNA
jgi:hypothetical protein